MYQGQKIPKSARAANRRLQDLQIQELWLDGYRTTDIALELGLSIPAVAGAITRFRNQLYTDSQATIQQLAAESASRLVRLQTELWRLYDEAEGLQDRKTILSELRKAEIDVAKVQNIINNKASVTTNVTVKLYDFSDNYPNSDESNKAIDVEFSDISSNGSDRVPHTVNDRTPHSDGNIALSGKIYDENSLPTTETVRLPETSQPDEGGASNTLDIMTSQTQLDGPFTIKSDFIDGELTIQPKTPSKSRFSNIPKNVNTLSTLIAPSGKIYDVLNPEKN